MPDVAPPPLASSSFTPRVFPRPVYPSARRVLFNAAYVHARDALLGAFLVALLWGPYQRARAAWPFGERWFYSFTVNATHTLCYVLFNGGLIIFAPMLGRYRMSRKPAEEPTAALYRQLMSEAALNHFVTSPIIGWCLYPLAAWLGTPLATEALPPLSQQLLLICAAHSFNDWLFYWSHRAFHHKLLYKAFHKQHHAFRGSVGAAAEFAHPVEVVVANQLPTVGFLLGVGAHPLLQAAWLALRLTQTYEVHSGYDFTDTWLCRVGLLNGGCAFHDHHHTANMGNFGSEHMDWLFGTMDHYCRGRCAEGYRRERGTLRDEPAEKKAG
uniref:Fatty acid hydroxylase domain-containing protein n=1 Tax=Calcidiscus leptoporus TaxID=127549 RepID=A0A7S0J978_9EUKA|mmetsp:Transcript_44638/g.104262  ORF Transcript_44638/g.104262 Transcript_44638/m.104262 type:complete len:326 (+) Transcript_44638:118-1095(+)